MDYENKAVGIVYNIILIASVLIMSILLLLTEECRENMKHTVVALILAKVLVPATIWALENIIAVVAVLLGIAMFTGFFLLLGRGLLEGGKNISDGENSASDIKKVDTAIVSAKRQEKKESLRKKEIQYTKIIEAQEKKMTIQIIITLQIIRNLVA